MCHDNSLPVGGFILWLQPTLGILQAFTAKFTDIISTSRGPQGLRVLRERDLCRSMLDMAGHKTNM